MNVFEKALEKVLKFGQKIARKNKLTPTTKEFKKEAWSAFKNEFDTLSLWLSNAKPNYPDFDKTLEAQQKLYYFMMNEFGNR